MIFLPVKRSVTPSMVYFATKQLMKNIATTSLRPSLCVLECGGFVIENAPRKADLEVANALLLMIFEIEQNYEN